jgi:hypothetical protein
VFLMRTVPASSRAKPHCMKKTRKAHWSTPARSASGQGRVGGRQADGGWQAGGRGGKRGGGGAGSCRHVPLKARTSRDEDQRASSKAGRGQVRGRACGTAAAGATAGRASATAAATQRLTERGEVLLELSPDANVHLSSHCCPCIPLKQVACGGGGGGGGIRPLAAAAHARAQHRRCCCRRHVALPTLLPCPAGRWRREPQRCALRVHCTCADRSSPLVLLTATSGST